MRISATFHYGSLFSIMILSITFIVRVLGIVYLEQRSSILDFFYYLRAFHSYMHTRTLKPAYMSELDTQFIVRATDIASREYTIA
jgi:hypothetical protein